MVALSVEYLDPTDASVFAFKLPCTSVATFTTNYPTVGGPRTSCLLKLEGFSNCVSKMTVTMDKLLLTLTLVAFSSGVLCNVEQNLTDTVNSSLDQMQIMNDTDNDISNITDSELSTIQEVFYGNGQPLDMYKEVKRCVDRVPRDDYVLVPGIGAYKLHKRSRKWNDARKSCMAEGGLLAILNSEAEGTMLQEWMKRENVQDVWIGTHDLFQQGEWVTLTGEALETAGYDRWILGEPNNSGGNEHCGNFKDKNGMNDKACDNTFYYFCKIYIC